MEETFQIPITYRGKELQFDAQLLKLGYIRKIQVDVKGIIMFLEKDDEGNYRAVIADIQNENKVDKALIKEIVNSLELILK
jgi:hypothetical protein